jgi:hypothetical protein
MRKNEYSSHTPSTAEKAVTIRYKMLNRPTRSAL